MSLIIGIDGPAASGKGTVTKRVAKILNLTHIDTGITYRCVALETLNRNVNVGVADHSYPGTCGQVPLQIKQQLIQIAGEINIEIESGEEVDRVLLNGVDVTEKIRSKEVTAIVSPISSIPEVRYKMVELQRKLAVGKDVIVEGRDICTFVFPEAQVKIYLDASLEERAKRRYKESEENGIPTTYAEVLENIKSRDYNDMHKEIGSLRVTNESIIVDTTNLSIDQVVDRIIEIIKNKMYDV